MAHSQGDDYFINVAGISMRQDAAGGVRRGDECSLVPEPDNEYDANAVMVVAPGGQIGYLPREAAATVKEAMAAGCTFRAWVDSVGRAGGGDGPVGVRLMVTMSEPPG